MKSRNKTTDDVELPSYCNPEDDTRYRNCHFIPNASVNTIPPSKCHVETSRSKSELFVYFVPSQNNNGTSNVSAALTSAFLFFFSAGRHRLFLHARARASYPHYEKRNTCCLFCRELPRRWKSFALQVTKMIVSARARGENVSPAP